MKSITRTRLGLVAAFAASIGLATFAPALRAESAGDKQHDEDVAIQHGVPRVTSGIQPLATTAHLDYYGGRVISNVQVVAVNWGSGVDSTVSSGIGAFYAAVTNSAYFDWLTEYNTVGKTGFSDGLAGSNQTIGRGTYLNIYTITPSNTSTNITDAQIQSELASQITAGHLPAPATDAAGNVNTIYMVNFPTTITTHDPSGGTSCVQFCAYHGTMTYNGKSTPYGVLPDLGGGCASGCGSSTKFNNTTSVASHELIEAVTDMEVGIGSTVGRPLAWYDSTNGEIGDICNAQQGTIAGYTVQKEWSNANNACIVTGTTTTNNFSMSISPSSASVAAGSSVGYTVSTTVTSGSAESLSLSVTGLPSGVTGSFSPSPITAGNSSTLTLTASSSAAAATATFTVTATGASASHTASASVSVTTTTTYSVSGNAGTTSATVTAGTKSATSDASSNYTISGLAAGTYTVTPSKSGCTFSPASSSVTITSANVTGVNFTASCGTTGGALTNGNFETGSLSPWTATGVSSILSSGAHGGTYAAQLGSTSPSTDSTLAQTFTLPANAGSLSFSVKITCPDTLTYDWATATLKDNSTAATTTVLAKTCSNTGAWQNVTASVAASAGHSVTLTFANHDDNYAGDATYSAWDDVTVTTSTPTYAISGSAGTSGANVSVGSASATSDASNNYSIAGLSNGSYTVTPSKSGCTFSPASQAVTVSSANVSGVNFTATCTGPTTLFSDGFEVGGWSVVDTSGTAGNWTLAASGTHPTQAPHGGTKLAVFNSYTSASGSQTRLYRSTGFAVASSFTTVSLKFWMYHDTGYSTYADKVQAQVSTNGTTWTNVGTAVARYTGSTGWTQASIDLSAYKGQTVYLAFVGQSAYGNNEYLDDVTVTAQ